MANKKYASKMISRHTANKLTVKKGSGNHNSLIYGRRYCIN